MKKKFLAVIMILCLAFLLAACGGDGGNGKDSGGQSQGSAGGEEKPGGGDKPGDDGDKKDSQSGQPGGSSSSGEADLIGRHIYKTVAFYGYLHDMYDANPEDMNWEYGYRDLYNAAVVLDYDTTTGKIKRKRVCVYYDCGDSSMYTEEELQQRAYMSVDGMLVWLPYTVEKFVHKVSDETSEHVGVLIWEIPEVSDVDDPQDTAHITENNLLEFDSGIEQCFLVERSRIQDIDGFINDYLYDDFRNSAIMENKSKPYPVIGQNYFKANHPNIGYTMAWYDTEWDIKMYDPAHDVLEAAHNKGTLPTDKVDWSPDEYGTTSFNTGGGYTGTYRYEDCIIPWNN